MAEAPSADMDIRRRASTAELLFRPFVYIAGINALIIGLCAILLTGLIAWVSHSHFDGVLDFHTGLRSPLHLTLLEGLIDWLSLALVLLVLGKLASRTAFRAIDLIATQAMARWPTLILALAALAPPYRRFSDSLASQLAGGFRQFSIPPAELVAGALVILIAILTVVWMIALMYQSYTISCNIRGGKAIASFVGGLIIAEVISKIAILRLLTA